MGQGQRNGPKTAYPFASSAGQNRGRSKGEMGEVQSTEKEVNLQSVCNQLTRPKTTFDVLWVPCVPCIYLRLRRTTDSNSYRPTNSFRTLLSGTWGHTHPSLLNRARGQ